VILVKAFSRIILKIVFANSIKIRMIIFSKAKERN
jgi:hypothetical protein